MMKETVLYYNPNKAAHAAKLKSVFVRMGIRIKNISEVQLDETVGYLSGVNGFEAVSEGGSGEQPEGSDITGEADNGVGAIDEEMLVMKDFSDRRLNELLMQMRKAGVPKINLKAVVTEHNIGWTFRQLYEEIKKEHEQMSGIASD